MTPNSSATEVDDAKDNTFIFGINYFHKNKFHSN